MTSSVSSIEQKIQSALIQQKLGTFDEEGKVRKFDIREDPEQRQKCEETMELLLAAGYFRVRIKGLSEFDKVVGGLAWSIQACNFTVDIDVLYRENDNLGQKLALTERIVVVISQMKCPYSISPHQIQGGDFIHIFPVVQWLVKKVFEVRAEIGDSNRRFVVEKFEKEFPSSKCENTSKENLRSIRIRNGAKRFLRFLNSSKRDEFSRDELKQRVDLVLFEFGRNSENFRLDEKHFLKEKTKIPGRNVVNLFDRQENRFRQIIDDFQEKRRVEESKNSEIEQKKTALRTLTIKLDKQKDFIENLERNIERTKTSKAQSRNSALQVKEEMENLIEELNKIAEENKNFDEKTLQNLQDLVKIYDELKQTEAERRKFYNEEKEKLEKEILQIETNFEKIQKENEEQQQEKLAILHEKIQRVTERFNKQRQILAKKNREISMLNRRIDEIPSSVELAQYRQAFFHLYNQSAVLYRQTKQNFTLYNTFTDLISYMKKEISLIESISQNFPQAIGTASGKENFLKQLETIVETVRQNRLKIEHRKQEEKCKRDALNGEWSELVEKSRQYAKLLKDFQEAIKENEMLHGERK